VSVKIKILAPKHARVWTSMVPYRRRLRMLALLILKSIREIFLAPTHSIR
jgi:hypothetical protein